MVLEPGDSSFQTKPQLESSTQMSVRMVLDAPPRGCFTAAGRSVRVSAQLKCTTSTHYRQGMCWDNLQKLHDCVGDTGAKTIGIHSLELGSESPCRSLPPWSVGVREADTRTRALGLQHCEAVTWKMK